jgi:hypothetical protein
LVAFRIVRRSPHRKTFSDGLRSSGLRAQVVCASTGAGAQSQIKVASNGDSTDAASLQPRADGVSFNIAAAPAMVPTLLET